MRNHIVFDKLILIAKGSILVDLSASVNKEVWFYNNIDECDENTYYILHCSKNYFWRFQLLL